MTTIKEVARHAGVSVATVSYVLNDTRQVRPETKKRVLAAAKKLAYSPNATARNLVRGRSSIVGLIVPDIRNPFFPEIATAFQEAANERQLETIVINTDYERHGIQTIVHRLAGLQMPGAAFFTSLVAEAVKKELAERKISAVYLDHPRVGPLVSNIAIDYRAGILAALDHLVKLGHRKIAFIGGPAERSSARKRQQAFLEGAKAAGVSVKTFASDYTVEGGYASCVQMLESFPATAVMTANDLMAIGALHCAYERGITVPKALSVVGFDDIMFARFTQPSLTSVAVPREEMGRLAFELLWELIEDPERRGRECTVKTNLIVRDTTARPAL